MKDLKEKNLLSRLLLKFKLEEKNLLLLSSEENTKILDLNVTVLINTLIKLNLENNLLKRKSNFIKLIKFEKIEVEDLNE